MGAPRLFFEAYGNSLRGHQELRSRASGFAKLYVRNSIAVISNDGCFFGTLPPLCFHPFISDSGEVKRAKRLCQGRMLPDKVPVS